MQALEAPKSSPYSHVRLSTMWMHKIIVAEAWIRILSYGGTGVYSLQPQRSRQVSCEARAWRRWGRLIAVCAGTDPIEASIDIGINSLDAPKCDCRGMAANSQLKRHGSGVSGSMSRVSSGERKSHGSWHVRHKGADSRGTEV